MTSRLLNQSLSQMGQQDRRGHSSGAGSRNSPYNRSSRTGATSDDQWKHDKYEAHNTDSSRNRARKSGDPQQRGITAASQLKPTGKVTIENLHYEVNERELRELFEQIGPVVKAFIKFDRSGRSTGQAVVIYQDAEHAVDAKNEFDGAKAKGQVLTITQEIRADRPKGRSNAAASSQGQDQPLLSRLDLMSRLGGGARQESNNRDGAKGSGSVGRGGGRKMADRLGPMRGANGTKAMGKVGTNQREKRKPATAAELDAELENFMKAPPPTNSTGDSMHNPSNPSQTVEDVEMA